MAYRYTKEEWSQIKRQREEEDRSMAIAHAEDMDKFSAYREEEATRGSSYARTIRGPEITA